MNGPDHYKEAERLLQLTAPGRDTLARAQAHAALAVAAATVGTTQHDRVSHEAWGEVLSS